MDTHPPRSPASRGGGERSTGSAPRPQGAARSGAGGARGRSGAGGPGPPSPARRGQEAGALQHHSKLSISPRKSRGARHSRGATPLRVLPSEAAVKGEASCPHRPPPGRTPRQGLCIPPRGRLPPGRPHAGTKSKRLKPESGPWRPGNSPGKSTEKPRPNPAAVLPPRPAPRRPAHPVAPGTRLAPGPPGSGGTVG